MGPVGETRSGIPSLDTESTLSNSVIDLLFTRGVLRISTVYPLFRGGPPRDSMESRPNSTVRHTRTTLTGEVCVGGGVQGWGVVGRRTQEPS